MTVTMVSASCEVVCFITFYLLYEYKQMIKLVGVKSRRTPQSIIIMYHLESNLT